jgi:hypothetical protein
MMHGHTNLKLAEHLNFLKQNDFDQILKIINTHTMMAAALLTVHEVDQEIGMYVEHIKFKYEQKAVHSELTKSKKPVSDGHIMEFRLDTDELQKLHFVSMLPHVKKILSSIVSKLEDILHTTGLKCKGTTEKGRKWSDVVAD